MSTIPVSPEVRALLEDEQRRRIAAVSRSRRRRRAWRLPLLVLTIGALAGLALRVLFLAMWGIG